MIQFDGRNNSLSTNKSSSECPICFMEVELLNHDSCPVCRQTLWDVAAYLSSAIKIAEGNEEMSGDLYQIKTRALQTAEKSSDRGSELYNASRYSDACSQYQKAVSIYQMLRPQSMLLFDALYNLGLCFFDQQDSLQAASSITEALAVYATEANSFGMASCHYELGRILKNQEKSVEHFSQVETLLVVDRSDMTSRSTILNFIALGDSYLQLSRYNEASSAFQTAIHICEGLQAERRNKMLNTAHWGLGDCHFNQHNYPKALTVYERALTFIDEKSNQAAYLLYQIGRCYNLMSNIQTALEYYERAVTIYQSGPDADELVGIHIVVDYSRALEQTGKFDRSLTYAHVVKDVFERKDKDRLGEAFLCIGNSLEAMGNFSEAVHCYQNALQHFQKLNPPSQSDVFNCLNNAVCALVGMGDIQAAIDKYLRGIAMKEVTAIDIPNLSNTYHNLASAYALLGKYGEAIEYLEKGWQNEKNRRCLSDGAICTRLLHCQVLVALGHSGKASEILEHVQKLPFDPSRSNHAYLYFTLGMLRMEEGFYDEAVTNFRIAVEKYKTCRPGTLAQALAMSQLAWSLAETGHLQEAANKQTGALEIMFHKPQGTPEMARIQNNGGRLEFLLQNYYGRAIDCYHRAVDILDAKCPLSTELARACVGLAETLFAPMNISATSLINCCHKISPGALTSPPAGQRESIVEEENKDADVELETVFSASPSIVTKTIKAPISGRKRKFAAAAADDVLDTDVDTVDTEHAKGKAISTIKSHLLFYLEKAQKITKENGGVGSVLARKTFALLDQVYRG